MTPRARDGAAGIRAGGPPARAAPGREVALERLEEDHHLLLDAARLLSGSLDLDATLEQVTALIVPRLAEHCRVYLLAPDLQEVASAHVHPEEPGSRDDPTALPELMNQVWRTGRPLLISQESSLRISYALVPLIARGNPLGALLLADSVEGRRFDPADHTLAELLELVGARAALALDNARLYTEARQAHASELRASRLEAQLVQARLEALRAQLNPHFLFNALNTIAMLVRRQANAEALRGIVGLSQLLRQVLDRRDAPEVSLGEELALVEHYIALEQLRYPDRLRTRIRVTPDLLDAQVPSLLLQPLVENAVRHGVGGRPDAGFIEVVVARDHDLLVLEVRDDGPGLPRGWSPRDSCGVGLANTRERLQRLYGSDQSLQLRSDSRGGTVAVVRIPFHTAPRA